MDDYTLQLEITLTVDSATRLLTALQEFSVLDSRNGNVALQSFLFRRSLATSLLGETNGVLNQLHCIGAKNTHKIIEQWYNNIFRCSISF